MAAPAAAQPPALAHALSAAGVAEGDFIGVRYRVAGPALWHERLVLLLVPPHSFTVLTPDGDCYEEDLLPGGDIEAWTPLTGGVSGGGAPAIGAQRIYGFRALPLLHQVTADRVAAAARLNLVPSPAFAVNVGRVAAGGPPVPPAALAPAGPAAAIPPGGLAPGAVPGALGGAPVPLAPAPGGGAPALGGLAGLAAALAPGGAPPGAPAGLAPGAPVAPGLLPAPAPGLVAPAGALPPGGALAAPGILAVGVPPVVPPAAPLRDARVLDVVYDQLGQRHLDFREAVLKMREDPWPDWPIAGPRTALWCCRFIAQHGSTPMGRHVRWRQEAGLTDSDLGVDEHEKSCRALEHAAVFDQVNVPNLASLEVICRDLQVQEERYRERVANPDQAGVDRHLFMSSGKVRGNLCICPDLQSWVTAELTRESAIAKERRKAREERALASGGGADAAHPRPGPKKR